MPTSALSRSMASLAIVVGVFAATLAAPTAQAADGGDRKVARTRRSGPCWPPTP